MQDKYIKKIISLLDENETYSDDYIFNSLGLAPDRSHSEVKSILKTIGELRRTPKSIRAKLVQEASDV